ncbi:unnamed protein product [Linum trigynum]|uniref:Uncharacterized protein n=1 Tax=Linum trigynum TaxID=586398 RepID=A0AAV2D6H5_9ROSI
MKSSSILIFVLLMICLIHGKEAVAVPEECRAELCEFAKVHLDTRYQNVMGSWDTLPKKCDELCLQKFPKFPVFGRVSKYFVYDEITCSCFKACVIN